MQWLYHETQKPDYFTCDTAFQKTMIPTLKISYGPRDLQNLFLHLLPSQQESSVLYLSTTALKWFPNVIRDLGFQHWNSFCLHLSFLALLGTRSCWLVSERTSSVCLAGSFLPLSPLRCGAFPRVFPTPLYFMDIFGFSSQGCRHSRVHQTFTPSITLQDIQGSSFRVGADSGFPGGSITQPLRWNRWRLWYVLPIAPGAFIHTEAENKPMFIS